MLHKPANLISYRQPRATLSAAMVKLRGALAGPLLAHAEARDFGFATHRTLAICGAVGASRSPIAQLVEHSTVNRMVAGSSPARGANKIMSLRDLFDLMFEGVFDRAQYFQAMTCFFAGTTPIEHLKAHGLLCPVRCGNAACPPSAPLSFAGLGLANDSAFAGDRPASAGKRRRASKLI